MSISRPTSCPWGKIQHCERLDTGVYLIQTAGHGGILVHSSIELSKEIRSMKIPVFGTRSSLWRVFEEDCDAALIILEYRLAGKKNLHENAQTESLIKSLSRWHPEFLISKGIEPDADRYNEWKEDRIHEKRVAEGDPNYIVSRSSTKNDNTLMVTTADRKTYLVERPVEKTKELSEHKILRDLAGVWTGDFNAYLNQIPSEILAMISDLLSISPDQVKKDKENQSYIKVAVDDNFEHMLDYIRVGGGEEDEVASIHVESYPHLLEAFKRFLRIE